MDRLGCSLWRAGERQRGKHPPRDPLISRYVPSSGLLFSLWTQHMSVDHLLDAEFVSRPLQMRLARGPFPSVAWGNEEGRNNLSKLWTDYIHENISAFNAVLTTESIRREKWGWGSSSHLWEDLLLLEDPQEEESGSWLWPPQFDSPASVQSLQIAGKAQRPPAHVEPADQRRELSG